MEDEPRRHGATVTLVGSRRPWLRACVSSIRPPQTSAHAGSKCPLAPLAAGIGIGKGLWWVGESEEIEREVDERERHSSGCCLNVCVGTQTRDKPKRAHHLRAQPVESDRRHRRIHRLSPGLVSPQVCRPLGGRPLSSLCLLEPCSQNASCTTVQYSI